MPLYDDVISAPDLLLLDSAQHTILWRRLNITPRLEVATCLINGTPTRYPVSDLTVDNAVNLTNARQGMLYHIGTSPGAFDIAYGTIRKTPPNSTTLPIDFKELGDPGSPAQANNIFNPIVDNLFVTIYKLYPPFTELSRIANNVILKRGDLTFSNQTATLPPVANIGAWQAGVVGSNGLYRVRLSAAESFDWYNAALTYSWDIDGGTLVSGYALSNQTIEVDYAPGFYVPGCTITGSGAKTHLARTYIWANQPGTANAPFSDRYICQLGGIKSHRSQGSEFRFTVAGSNHMSEIFPGAGLLYQEAARFGAQELSDSSIVFDRFVGYIRGAVDVSATPGVRKRGYVAVSPLAVNLPNPRQYLVEKATPTSWIEISASNVATAADYLLRWHASNLLMMHDFIIQTGVTLRRKKSFVFEQTGLQNQLQGLAEQLVGNIGSSVEGTTLITLNPAYLLPAERDAIPVKIRLTAGRYIPPLSWVHNYDMATAQTDGYSFAFGGGNTIDPYGARAPGRIQAQGLRESRMPTFIIPRTSQARERTLRIVGTKFAHENATFLAFSAVLDRNLDVIEPADLRTFLELELDEFTTPQGGVLRMLPLAITRRYTERNGLITKQITADFEPLAVGQKGRPIDLSRAGAGVFLLEGWTIQDPALYDTPLPDFDTANFGANQYAVAWTDGGILAVTATLLNERVYWFGVNNSMSGKVVAAEWSGDQHELFVVTVADDTIRIYVNASIASRPNVSTTWTLLQTITVTGEGFSGYVGLAVDPDNSDRAGICWYEQNATKLVYSTNGFTGITTVDVGGDPQDTNSDGYRPALICKANVFYLWANETDSAGVFANVTFDSGGYSNYSDESNAMGTVAVAAVGNPGNAIQAITTSINVLSTMRLRVNLGGYHDITEIEWDYRRDDAVADGVVSRGIQIEGQSAITGTSLSDASWHSHAATEFGGFSPPYNASYVDILLKANSGPHGGGFDWRLDNIKVYTPDGIPATPQTYLLYKVVAGVATPLASQPADASQPGRVMSRNGTALLTDLDGELYRVTAFETLPVWNSEPPAAGYDVHERPSALALAPTDTNDAYLVADSSDRKIYKSDDGGNTWTAILATANYSGVRRYGTGGLFFGFNRLDITENDGVSVHSRLGNWLEEIGSIGLIEGVRLENDQP